MDAEQLYNKLCDVISEEMGGGDIPRCADDYLSAACSEIALSVESETS